jgi:surfeit locus 1 family protein
MTYALWRGFCYILVLPQLARGSADGSIAALPDFAFRRVLLKGVIANPPLFLGPIVEHGAPGSYIIQPFIRSDGSTVLLNRGFVTVTRADAIRAGKQVPQGMTGEEVVIEGMISKKFDEGKGWWAHDNEPENNLWFWKDIKGMAEWVKSQGGDELGEVQPVLVDAIDREFGRPCGDSSPRK